MDVGLETHSVQADDTTITSLSSNRNRCSGNDKEQEIKNNVSAHEESSKERESILPNDEDYPDGGLRAWMIVIGAMCNTFSTFGYVNSWGIFQGYYERTLLIDSSPSTISWIGSVQYSLILLPALFVGRLFDLGYFRAIFLTSSALLVGSTFLIAHCTKYWHFLLCQGFAVGLACGGIFGPTVAVIAHWFKRKRGLAMGIVAVGSSIGGMVLPIAAKNLIPVVGFPWTMRIIGFILILTVGIANLTMKRRLPPNNSPGGLLNVAAFKSAAYTIYCISGFVVFLGLYTVLTYVDVSATAIGISPNFSFYFVAIANAGSLVGRYVCGTLSDSVGSMNVMIPFTALAGILTYAWPFARTRAPLLVITVFYGFSSGAYVSLFANPIMELGDHEDVGRRIGMCMSIAALGAVAGPPISGAINSASGGFEAVGYYAGTIVLVGVGLMCLTRHLVLRRLIGKF